MQLSDPYIQENSNAYLNSKWVGLDNAEEWSTFSISLEGGLWESRLSIEGMHCASCGFIVEKALAAVDGVVKSTVNPASGKANLVWDAEETTPSQWMDAISKAGYQPFPQAASENYRLTQQRLLMWRWLVAGFCMMQVMMYALPAHITNPGDITPDLMRLLRWASWTMSLPVILFSCSPFFTSALNDLKLRQISMDLPVVLGIVITFCVSSAGTFQPQGWWGQEVYFDSLTMFVFFLLTGRWLEARMRNRTAGALDELMRRLPVTIERQNANGLFARVPVKNLNINDVLRVFPGEAFPADGEIILGDTTADEALLTGESRSINKPLGAQVITGSHNLSSAVNIRVLQLSASSQYAQIVQLMERVSVGKPQLAKLADRIAKPFLLFVILAAATTAFMFWDVDQSKALMSAVAVLIVTCPCALSLATPAAMLASAGSLAKKGVLVSNLQALEALAKANTVIFDKTGTLTSEQSIIVTIEVTDGLTEDAALLLAASVAQYSLHPVSRVLVDTCGKELSSSVLEVKEIPGFGLIAQTVEGEVRVGSAKHCGVSAQQSESMQVFLSGEQGWIATFTLEEDIRENAKQVLQTLHKNKFKLVMLTGDRSSAAKLVAGKLSIDDMQAECTPQQKLAYMRALKNDGAHIVMVGDGLNDGPVLAAADVSIAMGKAVPLAQAKSDFILQSSQLAILPQLILQSQKTMRIVKQNLTWAAVYNAICIPLAVLGYLPAWLAGLGMALSSLIVVMNALRLSKLNSISESIS